MVSFYWEHVNPSRSVCSERRCCHDVFAWIKQPTAIGVPHCQEPDSGQRHNRMCMYAPFADREYKRYESAITFSTDTDTWEGIIEASLGLHMWIKYRKMLIFAIDNLGHFGIPINIQVLWLQHRWINCARTDRLRAIVGRILAWWRNDRERAMPFVFQLLQYLSWETDTYTLVNWCGAWTCLHLDFFLPWAYVKKSENECVAVDWILFSGVNVFLSDGSTRWRSF